MIGRVIDDWPSWPWPLSERLLKELAAHHEARLPIGYEGVPVMDEPDPCPTTGAPK